jgi:hypothetical protein
MLYQITEIQFDFDDDEYTPDVKEQSEIVDEALGQIWEASDDDDLVEEVTAAYGWCIKSIDYRHILS